MKYEQYLFCRYNLNNQIFKIMNKSVKQQIQENMFEDHLNDIEIDEEKEQLLQNNDESTQDQSSQMIQNETV